MSRSMLTRRRLLQNAALATLVGPVLRKMEAQAAAAPRRVILIFSPNGPMIAAGPASGTETAFTFHDWWKPLERHKADGIFFSHMASTGTGTAGGVAHGLGGQVFSGFGAGYNGNIFNCKGPSIDQVIGGRLEAENRAGIRRSLTWGAAKGGFNGFWSAPGRSIVPEVDPSKAWADVFSGFMAPADGSDAAAKRAAALLAREQSVLDFVNEDCNALRTALGVEGKRLLDEHCATVRSMERNLATSLGAAAGGRCVKPANPGARDFTNPENIDQQIAAFIDLIATTLACELSHVIAFQFAAQAARNRIASRYGVPSAPTADTGDSGPAHHPWTHLPPSEAKQTALGLFTTFYASQVAMLVDKLKSTLDASGKPLLDSTVVVWASELGGNEKNTDVHQTGSQPVVVFGRGQGLFRTGRYLHGKSPDTGSGSSAHREAANDMARLLVSVIQYMGLSDVDTVGTTGVKGPLMSLYA